MSQSHPLNYPLNLDEIGKYFIKACYSTICQLYLKIRRLQIEPLQAIPGVIIKQSDSNPTKTTIIFSRLWIRVMLLEDEHCSIAPSQKIMHKSMTGRKAIHFLPLLKHLCQIFH